MAKQEKIDQTKKMKFATGKIKTTQGELEFLKQSNYIEREYSSEALTDAIIAWDYGKKFFNKNKLTIDMILEIHKKLLRIINPRIAGKIRDEPVYIGGQIRDQSKEEIISELNELCDLWNNNKITLKGKQKRKQDREEFIKRWHIKFELCHFASDGNGRTGRILMNLQRRYLNLPILIIHEGEEQQRYYLWFRSKRTFLWKHQQDKIIEEYNKGKGKSVGEIADEMDLNHQLVSNLLKRNGIKVIVRWNNPPKGNRNGNWEGGIRYIKGYKHFLDPKHNLARADGYVPEHRAIVQDQLGRKLKQKEVVHHKKRKKRRKKRSFWDRF